VLAAVGEPVGSCPPVDRAFVGEDRIDLANRLEGKWCRRRLVGAGEVGELEELSPGVGPAEGFGCSTAGTCRRVEPAKPL
jgi:hypothetical protein